MRDSVLLPRYSPVCNVLRQWKTSLIPTYRVYRLYDIYKSGVEEDPNNYRGIMLLNLLVKIFTPILNSIILSWAEDNFVK